MDWKTRLRNFQELKQIKLGNHKTKKISKMILGHTNTAGRSSLGKRQKTRGYIYLFRSS